VLSQIIKLPAEGYALILAITGIVYQIETVVNVIGSGAVSYIVSHSEGSATPAAVRDFI
jgi:Na+/H+-dicarboxylate symporter